MEKLKNFTFLFIKVLIHPSKNYLLRSNLPESKLIYSSSINQNKSIGHGTWMRRVGRESGEKSLDLTRK